MSAAAVIAIRIKRIARHLKEHNAISKETAVPQDSVPYSDRWYYRRMVRFGAVKTAGDQCWLDEPRFREFQMHRMIKAVIFLGAALIGFLIYLVITGH